MDTNTTFRSISSTEDSPSWVDETPVDQTSTKKDFGDTEPIENPSEIVFDSLGVVDDESNLSEEDKTGLQDIVSHLKEVLKRDGVQPTKGAFKRALERIKNDLDIDPDTEPSKVINKISGVVNSWKNISFIKDISERKSLFSKLMRMNDSKSMDDLIFNEMNKRKVYNGN